MKITTLLPHSFYYILALFAFCSCQNENLTVSVQSESSASPVKHGILQMEKLQDKGIIEVVSNRADIEIKAVIDSVNLVPEAYKIDINGKKVKVTGGDETGLMYGLLEIKEQLENGNRSIQGKQETPNLSFRALKFNLPWDSYRTGEALQLHYETCRDTNFWESFLDMMAENRFNKLTLWNLHPFNYLVRTEKYPEASGFTNQELAEWQQFWHSLFRMAKDRGIETYLVNWNIFVSPEFAKAHNVAAYSINGTYFSDGDTSEIIKDYTRESIKAVIDTYPNLTGLGITLGEGMGGMTAEEREQWLLDSYIEGMRMASRKIKFIHRVPLSAGKGSGGSTSASVEEMTRQTLDTLTCVDGAINIELKFNWSHAHSTQHLVKVHGGKLTDAYWNPMPENYYLAWMMRNEDFFMLRWGQPDFIRQHIAMNVHPYVNGYYLGSECYIPAKDYITALDGASNNYAFQRQWMFYKVWGRLLYNPETQDAVFIDAFENRFSGNGEKLFGAQTKVSRIPLIIASYQNPTWDFTLYSEGMLTVLNSHGKRYVGLIPLTDMADKIPMEPAYLSISEFLENENNIPSNKISPLQLADSIDSFCRSALLQVENIETENNVDLLYEISDIKTWANLGMYFSNKLRAALEYKRFTISKENADLERAVSWLEKATANWHSVVEITEPIYDPVPLEHLEENDDEYFHWSKIESQVTDELDWLKSLSSK